MDLPLAYQPIESSMRHNIPTYLAIPSNPATVFQYNWKAIVIRLITGNLDVKSSSKEKIIAQRNNYMILGGKKSRSNLTNVHLDLQISAQQLERFLDKTDPKNRTFYAELFMEISRHFWLIHTSNFIGAFLHSYRILEKISIVLPLVWSAKATDYTKSFNALKTIFGENKEGEMKALQKFIAEFIDEQYLLAPCKINFTSLEPIWRQEAFKTMSKTCRMVGVDINNSSPPNSIDLKYVDVIPILITTRNMYFHRLTGKGSSFGFAEIPDPDSYFNDICNLTTNWLLFIIGQIMVYEAQNS